MPQACLFALPLLLLIGNVRADDNDVCQNLCGEDTTCNLETAMCEATCVGLPCCQPGPVCDNMDMRSCVGVFDKFCLADGWDMQCVSEAKMACGLVCDGGGGKEMDPPKQQTRGCEECTNIPVSTTDVFEVEIDCVAANNASQRLTPRKLGQNQEGGARGQKRQRKCKALCPTDEISMLSVPTIRTRCSDDTTSTGDQRWQGRQFADRISMTLGTRRSTRTTLDDGWDVVGQIDMTNEMLGATDITESEEFVAEVEIDDVLFVLSFVVMSVESDVAYFYTSDSSYEEVALACDFTSNVCDVSLPSTSAARRLLRAASLFPGGTTRLLKSAAKRMRLPKEMASQKRRLTSETFTLEIDEIYDYSFEFTLYNELYNEDDETQIIYCCLWPQAETSGDVLLRHVFGANYECGSVNGVESFQMDDKGTNYFGLTSDKSQSYSGLAIDTTYSLYCASESQTDLQDPFSITTQCAVKCDRCYNNECYDCNSGYCLNDDPTTGCHECECEVDNNGFEDCTTQPDNPLASTVTGLGNYDGCTIICYTSGVFDVREDNDDDDSCFPGDALVSTPTGPKPIAALRPLDKVLSVSSDQKGSLHSKFERVWWVTHAREDQSLENEFLRLSLASGQVLELTADHLVYVGGCCGSQHARPAKSVVLGDTIFTVGEDLIASSSEVRSVGVVSKRGKFSVFVTGGSMAIVVNGVVASSLVEPLEKYGPLMQFLGGLVGLMLDCFQSLNRLFGQAGVEKFEEDGKQALEMMGRVVDFAFSFIQDDHYLGVLLLFLAVYIPGAILFGVLLGLRCVFLTSPALQIVAAVAMLPPAWGKLRASSKGLFA